jgi:hypothetical protein
MILMVATTADKANADRVVRILKKAGSTHIKKTRKGKGAFVVEFTQPNDIEQYLLRKKAAGRKALNGILRNAPLNSSRRILGLLFDGSPDGVALKNKVVELARKTIPRFPR